MIDWLVGAGTAAPVSNPPRILSDLSATSIDGVTGPLSEFAEKVVLISNTASHCGFTRQYQGLEDLWRRYQDDGLVVLGFPSNDFGAQEPGTDTDIKSFCSLTFGVSFPLFSKGHVRGPQKQDTFRFLTGEGPPRLRSEVRWNFEKFLIDRSGRLIGRWRSFTAPTSSKIVGAVEAVL